MTPEAVVEFAYQYYYDFVLDTPLEAKEVLNVQPILQKKFGAAFPNQWIGYRAYVSPDEHIVRVFISGSKHMDEALKALGLTRAMTKAAYDVPNKTQTETT